MDRPSLDIKTPKSDQISYIGAVEAVLREANLGITIAQVAQTTNHATQGGHYGKQEETCISKNF